MSIDKFFTDLITFDGGNCVNVDYWHEHSLPFSVCFTVFSDDRKTCVRHEGNGKTVSEALANARAKRAEAAMQTLADELADELDRETGRG